MKNTTPYLIVKDHSVSGEEFKLVLNEEHGFLETIPQPKEENLSEYYKTEDYISHTDSKRNLFEKAYHVVRNISLKRKLKLINRSTTNSKTLLDIGCGTGDFLHTTQKKGWSILGIEPNEKARQIANTKTNNAVYNIDHLLSLEDHSFDVITLWHVLEHLPNLENHISVFKRLLKKEGALIIAVPNFKSYDAQYYKSHWAAYDVPRHLWHFSQASIKKIFDKYSMTIHKTLPMKFDAYYVSLLSEKYKTGKMNFFNAIRLGYMSNLKANRSGEYSSLIYILKNTK